MYKALVVDDEKMIRQGIERSIPWREIQIGEVYTAASAKDALQITEEHQPEILITDINMTEMTGLDLIAHIRKYHADMRVIVITGYDRFEYARQCLQMQVQELLLKPVDEEELIATLRKQTEALDLLRMSRETDSNQQRAQGSRRQAYMEKTMRDLIRKDKAAGKIRELCKEFHFREDQTMRCAILLPGNDGEADSVDAQFRQMMVKNICIGLIDGQNAGITFTDQNGRLAIAFFTGESCPDVMEEMERLSSILEDEYNVKPHIVLGNEISGFAFLYTSYNDAVYLLEHERKKFEEIVKTKADRNRDDMFREVYREFKQNMTNNVADSRYVLHVFERFAKATRSYHLSPAFVQRSCFELAAAVYYSYIKESGGSTQERLDTLISMLSGTGREEACEITRMFLSGLLQEEERESNEIITKARRYIEEHLEEDLSVTTLAASFYVSPNYFSRLFKKVMGEGCNEYIVCKRIEKAKTLLETTNLKAGKIAYMVGYNDTNYFSLAFKKHLGVSPTKYRERAREE